LSELDVGAHFKLGAHGCAGYDTFKLVRGKAGPEVLHIEQGQVVRLGPQTRVVAVGEAADSGSI
jgi:hypothetical protein